MNRRLPDAPLAVAALFTVVFYFWTAAGGYPFSVGQHQGEDSLYNRLAEAFRHGQLHLLVAPRPEVFEMTNPYEPGKNAGLRLHDASLYHGRHYVYFGIGPVLLLYLPWQLLGLGDLPDPLAAAILASLGVVFWSLALRHLVRAHLPGTPPWMEAGAFLILGLTDVVPFILRGPLVYEVAIAGGQLFLGAGTWLLLTARGRPLALALGGAGLGLAVACRPNHVLVVPILLLLAWPDLRRAERRRRAAAFLLAPLVVVGLLLGAYNRARFGSWTEFGTGYQLSGVRPISGLDPRGLLPILYLQFLAPPALRLDFPFVLPDADYPGRLPEGFFISTHTTGLLFHAPFVLILLLAPRLLRAASVAEVERLRWSLWILVSAGVVSPLLTGFVFSSAAMRFQADFAALLLLPALLLWLLAGRSTTGPARWLWGAAGALALGWSLVAGLCLSITGGSDWLRTENPPAFEGLGRRFEPLRLLLGRLFVLDGRGVARMRVAFPERLAYEREPLLSSGSPDRFDVIWVRQPGPGLFAFELDPGEGEPQASRPLRLEPGRFYDLEVDLDHVGRSVRVAVDGRETVTFAARIGPVHANRLWPARGPRGHGAMGLSGFSGILIPEDMVRAGPPGLEALPPVAGTPAIHTDAADPPPAGAKPGQLWVPAPKDGAYLFTGSTWRWVPQRFLDRVRFDRTVAFAQVTGAAPEPLVAWSDGEVADAVFVRHLDGGRVAFGLAHWRGRWDLDPLGAPVDVASSEHALRVVVDRAEGHVSVSLDGRIAFESRGAVAPLWRSGLFVGQSPPGTPLGRGLLSARLRPSP